jgi:uncharacterized protein (TIGR03435 family)
MALRIALVALVGNLTLTAQQQRDTFEVASVKMSPSAVSEGGCAPNSFIRGQRFAATNCPLGFLIMYAYDISQQQLSGQHSLLGDKFDISAKAEHPASQSQMKGMLQSLLEDRFRLKLRRDTKEIPVYALVVGKGGPKFHQSHAGVENGPKFAKGGTGQTLMQNASIADFLFSISKFADRMIVDKSGLEDKYDFDITRVLELRNPDAPSVFTVVEELGLKLDPRKNIMPVFVIEQVERPSAN